MEKYFAASETPKELADAIRTKKEEWRKYCAARGLLGIWERKINNYYGNSANGNKSSAVTPGGAEGELLLTKVNSFRNLIQNQLTLITANKPAGQAVAINSDTTSLKQSRIGTSLAQYYMDSEGFESKFISACETALLCDESFCEVAWDKDAGSPIAVDPITGLPEMSGDAKLHVHSPWNVARDPGANVSDQNWYIISTKINKYEAAARYPKFQDEILSIGVDSTEIDLNRVSENSDIIYQHTLIHDRSPVIPDGKLSILIGDKIVFDSGLPYPSFPITRIAPSNVINGPTGYSSSNDALGIAGITDALYSAIVTNNIVNAVQNFQVPQGLDINVSDIAKGMRLFEMPESQIGKLQALQLTQSAPETYKLIATLEQKQMEILGINNVTLGNPVAAGMSGASGSALALIQAQAISSNSGIQKSYYSLLSSTMTKLIEVLREYADTQRVIKIVGTNRGVGLSEFKYTGEDLNSISSISYTMVNPVSQSVGGRLSMAQELIQSGLIKSPKQYLNVLETGQLDTLTQDDENDQLLILEENQLLTDGSQPVKAIVTEIHADHIKSHMSTLSNVTAKNDPALVERTLAHIQEHLDLWSALSQNNPALLMATGQQPLPPSPMMNPTQAPQTAAVVGDGSSQPVLKAEEIQPARMPKVAGTNETAVVPGVLR